MRLFVATMLAQPPAAACGELVAGLIRDAGDIVRAVPAGSAHVTHAFLGEVPVDEVPAIEGAMRDVARSTAPFDVSLGAAEVLDSGRGPRLVFVPFVEGRQDLYDLQVALVLALRRVPACALLPMPRSPHVTLARFRRSAGRGDGRRIARLLERRPAIDMALRLDELQLMQSLLTPSGPEYAAVATVRLQG